MTAPASLGRARVASSLRLDGIEGVPARCERARPGLGHHNPRVLDWTQRPTTADQARIEEALETLLEPGQRILHVGVGNSSLALRFAARAGDIVGLTLSEVEREHARSLAIERYTVALVNKYGPGLGRIRGPFDFVVDNNPSSYACCLHHFDAMLARYASLLRAGGRMLTDREGMGWCLDDGPFGLRYEHLEAIGAAHPLEAERITDQVFALRRRAS